MRQLLSCLVLLLAVSACSGSVEDAGAPMNAEDKLKASRGKVGGDGFTLFGGSDDDGGGKGGAIGVNSYLWRASLDTLSFMPLASADPFGGVIITDWYEDPQAPGERFKANAMILDKTLRADGVRVTIFKQKQSGDQWQDAPVDATMARKIEDTILTRARQMRVAQIAK